MLPEFSTMAADHQVPDGPKMRHTMALKPEDSIEIRIIRRIFDMASHDTGCKEIANILNHEGFRTMMGERWGHHLSRNMPFQHFAQSLI
jgi:hypothetical protein